MLTVRYSRVADVNGASTEEMNHRIDAVLATMVRAGLPVNAATDDENGEWNWYKLSEWMQVEIVQQFGAYMEHTPWYRFPFFEYLKLYFGVLRQEFSVVQGKFGVKAAGFSAAFFVDLVPGIAMAALFAQLNTMAFPCRLALGDEYSEEELAGMVEELVVTTSPKIQVDWAQLMSSDVAVQQVAPGLHVLTVPSVKPFTVALMHLAEGVPSAKILRCSGHREVQVKVNIAGCVADANGLDRAVEALGALPGCDVKFKYQFPMSKETKVSVEVQVPALLAFLRVVGGTQDVDVDQVCTLCFGERGGVGYVCVCVCVCVCVVVVGCVDDGDDEVVC